MHKSWRLIMDDGLAAATGLAGDEWLALQAAAGKPCLRLYTYKNHSALCGRFQEISHEIHLDYCREKGIAINRRPTGGGAIFMGKDQLGIALCLPGKETDTYGRAREIMARFSAGIVKALQQLGVNARFRRKNDIEVDGKKIAGLGIYRARNGGLLFHSSLLLDMDIARMLRVLDTPFEKIGDKEVTTVAGRITTIRRETGNHLTMDELRRAVRAGYADEFDITLSERPLDGRELDEIEALAASKYRQDDWIYQPSPVADASGSAKIKTPAGLLDVRVTLAGPQMKAVYIRGDFFTAEQAIADFEGHLRWHSTQADKIHETLHYVQKRHEDSLSAFPLAMLEDAIHTAVKRARLIDKKNKSQPYGCFVTPGGAHA